MPPCQKPGRSTYAPGGPTCVVALDADVHARGAGIAGAHPDRAPVVGEPQRRDVDVEETDRAVGIRGRHEGPVDRRAAGAPRLAPAEPPARAVGPGSQLLGSRRPHGPQRIGRAVVGTELVEDRQRVEVALGEPGERPVGGAEVGEGAQALHGQAETRCRDPPQARQLLAQPRDPGRRIIVVEGHVTREHGPPLPVAGVLRDHEPPGGGHGSRRCLFAAASDGQWIEGMPRRTTIARPVVRPRPTTHVGRVAASVAAAPDHDRPRHRAGARRGGDRPGLHPLDRQGRARRAGRRRRHGDRRRLVPGRHRSCRRGRADGTRPHDRGRGHVARRRRGPRRRRHGRPRRVRSRARPRCGWRAPTPIAWSPTTGWPAQLAHAAAGHAAIAGIVRLDPCRAGAPARRVRGHLCRRRRRPIGTSTRRTSGCRRAPTSTSTGGHRTPSSARSTTCGVGCDEPVTPSCSPSTSW